MSIALSCLLGGVLWNVVLVSAVVGLRVFWVLAGQRAANSFPADCEHGGPPVYGRLRRAHLNCVENLPLFAVVVLAAEVTGRADEFGALAGVWLGARVAQSLVHLSGDSEAVVTVRAVFLSVQLGVVGWMLGALLIG